MDQEVRLDDRLEHSLLTTWNARIVDYDNDAFPFNEWVLERINRMGYPLEDLRYLHETIDTDKAYGVSKQLCADTNLPEFRDMVLRFVREVIAVKGELEPPLAVQRFLNVRIMLPNKPESVFPFHTGLLYGHGKGSRSVWMPLTDVSADEDYTASMQIIDVEKSRELVNHAIEHKLSVPEMTELFGKESWPLKAGPGKVVLFTQENIHGNFVNVTGKTRVSIDFRIAEAKYGDRLARKIAGGYFEIIPESEAAQEQPPAPAAAFANNKRNILYLNNSTSSTRHVPVHLQRYMLYEYCQNKGLGFEFELFELEDMIHLPTLQHMVENLRCNVVLYSIYSLPEDREFRSRIIDSAIANGVNMHFVNEDMAITCEADRKKVERTLEFAKFGQPVVGTAL